MCLYLGAWANSHPHFIDLVPESEEDIEGVAVGMTAAGQVWVHIPGEQESQLMSPNKELKVEFNDEDGLETRGRLRLFRNPENRRAWLCKVSYNKSLREPIAQPEVSGPTQPNFNGIQNIAQA